MIVSSIKSHCDCAPYRNGNILVPTPDVTKTVLSLSLYKPQYADEGASEGTHTFEKSKSTLLRLATVIPSVLATLFGGKAASQFLR